MSSTFFTKVFASVVLAAFLLSCAHSLVRQGDHATGLASWYGKDHHGKLTASGEKFNMHQLTAAHRTLPMNSVVMVTNLRTRKSVQLRINDRGPFAKGRLIDVSYEAAKRLDMLRSGEDEVEIEVISTP